MSNMWSRRFQFRKGITEMNLDASYAAFQVEQKDKDGKTIRVLWRRYANAQHKNAAKRLRRKMRSEGPTAKQTNDPWGGKRRRFFRLKPNNHCPCGAKWPDDDPVTIRAGKVKKFKRCCKK